MPNPDFKNPSVIGKNYVWDDGAQEWVPQSVSTGTGSDVNVTNTSLNVHNYVWDPDTLDWVEQTQAAAGGGGGDASLAEQQTQTAHLATLAGGVSGTEYQVDVVTSALPTGAATAARQDTGNTALAAIQAAVEALEPSPLTDAELRASAVPVSAASLPLPTGAATAANQTTGNTSLATLAGAVAGTEVQVDVVAALPAGNNNIGDVDVASLPALAAGTNLIGRVSASPETGTVYDGTTAITPKFAAIAAAGNGDNTLVAAVVGKKIRVLAAVGIAAGTVTARFESGAGGSALTGQMALVANMGFVLPFNPAGWFETASNTLLNLELSAGVSVAGALTYVEV